MATLLGDAALEDAPGRRLVKGVGRGQMPLVGGDQVGLEHAVDADDALGRLPAAFTRIQQIHEPHEPLVGGLRLLRR